MPQGPPATRRQAGRRIGASLAAGSAPRKRPYRVTFHEPPTTSRGRPRGVSLRTVYISSPVARGDAVAAAIRRFEADSGGRPWSSLADDHEIVEPH